MNIAQLSEQLKDVPQNRLIDYARNPNSVVPQFLALAEIQRRQHLQAQAQPAPATVAEDVLGQAAPAAQQMAQQLPENQPGVAQLPTGMPQGMASGGIVAFANGGDIDDEDDAYDPEEEKIRKDENLMMSLVSRLRSGAGEMAAAVPRAIQGIKAALPESYEKAKKSVSEAASSASDEVEGFLSKIKHLESRGRHFDAKGNILTSPKGAEGIMQVMRKTQRDPGFGVTPARDRSPEELERVGRDYGIAMLREFGDPKLAAMAYNWGPANVKKWLASGQKTAIPEETRKYASNFAKGGLSSLDDEEEDDYNPYAMMGDLGVSQPSYKSDLDLGIGQFLKRKIMGIQESPAVKAPRSPSPEDWQKFDQAQALFEAEQKIKAPRVEPTGKMDYDIGFGPNKYTPDVEPEVETPKKLSAAEQILLRNAEERQALKEQAQTDKYLAMLTGSLGMMAGTSPYAMANIGQGGIQGVAAYAAARKQRAAEAAQLGKEEREVIRAQQIDEYKREALAQEESLKKAGLGQRQIEAYQKQIANARDDLRLYEQMQVKKIENAYKNKDFDPKQKAAYDAAIANLYNDPQYLALLKLGYPNLDLSSKSTGTTTTGGWSIKPKQ